MYYQRMFKSTITGNKFVPEYLLRKFINKQSLLKKSNLHKKAKLIYNEMIKEPLPLKYKLQELPENANKNDFHTNQPLGNTYALPFQVIMNFNFYLKR